MNYQFFSQKNNYNSQCSQTDISLLNNIRDICSNIYNLLQQVHQGNPCEEKNIQPQQLISDAQNNGNRTTKIWKKIQDTIEKPTVNGFQEIAGLAEIKRILTAIVLLPKYQPQLYIYQKCINTVLLYGPPGTGKTKLVHALAAESEYVLHSLSSSSVLSSFVGETEKNIREIFDYLKNSNQFSILFIDEIDGLCRQRNSFENEYSRRIKTELMNQMNKMENSSNIILIAATNCPWDIDNAILRRFQKKIYISLPNLTDRKEIFQLLLKNIPNINLTEEFDELIENCEGFSGCDIYNMVNDALIVSLTELADTKIWQKLPNGMFEPYITDNPIENLKDVTDMENIQIMDLKYLPPCSIKSRQITLIDLINSAQNIKISVSIEDIEKYNEFNNKYHSSFQN